MNDIPIKGKRSRSLDEALDDIAREVWDGTRPILEALAYESKFVFAWRPVRAAALAAMRDISEQGPAMTGPEFETWRVTARAVAQLRECGNYLDQIGISQFQARQYSKNGAPKLVALACAHFLLGRQLPIQPGDHRAFDAWYTPRFGGSARVADWLGVSGPYIQARLYGFEMVTVDGAKQKQRVKREPEITLIRALDWVFNVGPVVPYGQKGALEVWPGQGLADDLPADDDYT